MRLVVDANILYSVALRTDGAVADVFFNTRPVPELCAPLLLRNELIRHRPKMARHMGKTVAQVSAILELLLRRVTLIDPAIIDDRAVKLARTMVRSVDPDDEEYVALALHLQCPLWTGDLKLARALQHKAIQVLSTADIRALHARG